MARIALLAALAAFASFSSLAFATQVSGDQSGTWSLAQSPYEIVGDVRVAPNTALTIEPGVVVVAQGYYKLFVESGLLIAVGTPSQPILMTATDHTTGWRGVRLLAADDTSVLSYCTIEYARGTGAYPDVLGGAIYCQNCAPTIANNVLRYNYSHNANSNGTGAGVTTDTSNAVIENNLIFSNQADSGAGICCLSTGSPRIIGNVITDNVASYAGGGIYAGAQSSPLIERNTILRNTSYGWGGGGINSWTAYIYYGTYATIRDNVIADNTSTTAGGGIYCRYDAAVITGNTIANNHAGSGSYAGGGGIYALNYPAQAPHVSNCILWGNTSAQGAQICLETSTGSAIYVSYGDVQDGWPGNGNIAADPLFVNPPAGDYHIAFPASPCIDAGDPGYFGPPGETDIDGQMRVWDGDEFGGPRIDIGADEAGSFVFGDLNCDGAFDGADIEPFFLAVGDPAAYAAAFPKCNQRLADVNGDGAVDGADIEPFFNLLSGG